MKYLIVFSVILLFASNVICDTIKVPQDHSLIQDAINAAVSGDSVVIADGHYFERLIISGKTLTIASEYLLDLDSSHIASTIIDGDTSIVPGTDSNSVIIVADNPSGQTNIIGLTIQNGVGSQYQVFSIVNGVGGGVLSANSTTSITNCIIRKNTSNNYGGGVFSYSGPITIDNCVIDSNQTANGGGICLFASTGSIVRNSLIKNNTGSEGGGGWVSFALSQIENNRFSNNHSFYGGGLFIQDNVSSVRNSGFDNNTAFRGAGIYSFQGADGDIIGCEFFNNTASLQQSQESAGGAICCLSSSPLIRGCTMQLNYADSGGGIYLNNSAAPDIENCIISFSRKGRAVSCSPNLAIAISCTNIFGNTGGDWTSCLAFKYLINGNLIIDPMYCQPNSPDLKLKSNSNCLPQNNSCGQLVGAKGQGCIVTDIVEHSGEIPVKYELAQNYPNPFNPSTTIEFSLSQKADINVSVYNVLGELVITLLNETKSAGRYSIFWNGLSQHGSEVSSGVYFYSIESETFKSKKKMILIK